MIRSLRRLAFALAALMLAAPAVAAPSDEMLVVSIELPAA
jgi:hypothetical protein